MSVAVRKVAGVEAVEVSLERGVADVRLTPGNHVTLAQLRQIVKNGGFNAREAGVSVAGSLTLRGGAPALAVSGTESVLLLAPDPAQAALFEQARARAASPRPETVTIGGTVRSNADSRQPDQLVVRTLSGGR